MKTIGNNRIQTHMTDLLFTLALFCVFAASALLVVVIGAGVYENTTKNMDRNFDTRTSISYVTTKIRQNDIQGAIYVDDLDGTSALVMEQSFEGEGYQTWIYYYDGALRELFVQRSKGQNEQMVHPEDGRIILETGGFEVEQAGDGLLRLVTVDAGGGKTEMLVSTRC